MGFVKAEKYREQRQLQVEMCLKLEPLAGVYSHGDGMVDISERVEASPINRRGSTVLLVPRENAVIDDRGRI